MDDDYGWRARWRASGGGSLPGAIPCERCRYARPHDALCGECGRCRDCAPAPWRVCSAAVKACGPWCGDCAGLAKHRHA